MSKHIGNLSLVQKKCLWQSRNFVVLSQDFISVSFKMLGTITLCGQVINIKLLTTEIDLTNYYLPFMCDCFCIHCVFSMSIIPHYITHTFHGHNKLPFVFVCIFIGICISLRCGYIGQSGRSLMSHCSQLKLLM